MGIPSDTSQPAPRLDASHGSFVRTVEADLRINTKGRPASIPEARAIREICQAIEDLAAASDIARPNQIASRPQRAMRPGRRGRSLRRSARP
eukprot:1100865-Pyramimonas_sp.AAC.1